VGEGAVDSILAGREDGPYQSLFDFMERVDLKRVNRRVLEALVKSGSCDCFGKNRSVLMHNSGRAFDRGQAMARDRATGQTSLFSLLESPSESGGGEERYREDCDLWLDRVRLAYEKEAIGFYVSGHPLDSYQGELKRYANHDTSNLDKVEYRAEVTLGAVVVAMRERPLRSGKGRMAFVTLEDLQGQIETIFFSKAYEASEAALKSGLPLLIYGQIRLEGDDDAKTLRLHASRAVLLSDIRREKTRKIVVRIDTESVNSDEIKQLNKAFQAHPGSCGVLVRVAIPGMGVGLLKGGESLRVDASEELVAAVERLLGKGAIVLA
jgi:DNA polymerase-3 subunit alpha